MVKRAKNPAQLTEEEKDMIDQIILITGAVFTSITSKSPKDSAEILISATKKKRIAGSYLLLNTRNINVSQVVTPANLNKELAKTMLDNANVKDPTDITTHVVGKTENNAYINSTDMTEILHILVWGNIYQNIIGKNEVSRLSRKGQRGRPPKNSDKNDTKASGRPSVYKITQDLRD